MIELPASQVVMWSMVAVQEGSGVLGAPSGGAPAGAAPGGAAGGGATQGGPMGGISWFMPMLAVMMVFLIISTTMSGRKDKKRRAAMLASVGKRDRVQTIGGMIGNIIEIKGDEYLLETDRGTNSRAWIAKTAVSAVIRSANAGGDGADATTEATDETVKA